MATMNNPIRLVYASECWPWCLQGKRTVLCHEGRRGPTLKLLEYLTESEIAAKLPVHLRYLPDAIAA